MSETRDYEAMIVIDPKLEEESRNEVLDRIKNLIEENGSLDKLNEWGVRRLAYEVNDISEGYYLLIDFKATPGFPSELERVMKIMDSVLRYLVIKK